MIIESLPTNQKDWDDMKHEIVFMITDKIVRSEYLPTKKAYLIATLLSLISLIQLTNNTLTLTL